MTRKKTTISLAPIESDEIESLVEEGAFTSKSDVLRTAFREMLEEKPRYKVDIAVNLYKKEKITEGRAAEIAGVSREEFKEILEKRGIRKTVGKKEDEKEKIEKLKAGLNE